MRYKAFVRKLQNLELYRRDAKDLQAEIDNLLYEMGGVRGVSFDRQGGTTNQEVKELHRLDLIEKYNRKLSELEFTKQEIRQIEDILGRMPEELKVMLDEIYIQNLTFRKVGELHGYSYNGIWKLMKRECEKYL